MFSNFIRKISIILEMIKFPHTLFALPFAFMGALLASREVPFTLSQLFWILIAMVGARNVGMAWNRLADKEIDALNPRTRDRALPRRLVTEREVIIFIILSLLLLLLAAFKLNPLCVKLYPVAVLILFLYPFTKRFTFASHLFLGLALGLAPLGSWIAITGRIGIPALILSATVIFWAAGFDIIYACQDVDFDKKMGLFSLPHRLGVKNSLFISAIFHLLTILLLGLLYFYLDLGLIYLIGLLLATVLLIYEHLMVTPSNLSKMEVAFYQINAGVSVNMFLFTLIDVYIDKF